MSKRICSLPDCEAAYLARGLCQRHYHAWYQGRLDIEAPLQRLSLEERFWQKVDADGDCWEWTSARHHGGYGVFQYTAHETRLAHRTSWELLVGPIPEGLTIDHLCLNKLCVNPDHLETVSAGENTMRSHTTVSGRNMRKTHCKRGHPLFGENLYQRPDGRRECRICKRAQAAK